MKTSFKVKFSCGHLGHRKAEDLSDARYLAEGEKCPDCQAADRAKKVLGIRTYRCGHEVEGEYRTDAEVGTWFSQFPAFDCPTCCKAEIDKAEAIRLSGPSSHGWADPIW
jgi:predicted RNA-binding Zn-ribbon protein involved in translation (DUF1610 family)